MNTGAIVEKHVLKCMHYACARLIMRHPVNQKNQSCVSTVSERIRTPVGV